MLDIIGPAWLRSVLCAAGKPISMNKYAKTLFELVKSSIDHNSKALAKRLARVSGAKSRPAVRQRLESQIRETLEQQTWDLLCLFDNGGCRLPNDVLGYRILASPTRIR